MFSAPPSTWNLWRRFSVYSQTTILRTGFKVIYLKHASLIPHLHSVSQYRILW